MLDTLHAPVSQGLLTVSLSPSKHVTGAGTGAALGEQLAITEHNMTPGIIDPPSQADTLRDEKDVLLTRLVIENKLPPEDVNPPMASTKDEADNETVMTMETEKPVAPEETPVKEVAASPPAIKSDETQKEEPPKIKLGAKIRDLNVTYDHSRAILQAQFRIFNDNQPKTPLAGRVVVYTTMADLLDDLRQTFKPKAGLDFSQLFNDVLEAEVLCLDEIEKFSPTLWAEEKFYQIVDHRYRHWNTCVTVLATNRRIGLDQAILAETRFPGYLESRIMDGRFMQLDQFWTVSDARPALRPM